MNDDIRAADERRLGADRPGGPAAEAARTAHRAGSNDPMPSAPGGHRGRAVLQLLGGGALAVVLLLPLLMLQQQTTELRLARLELEQARLRSALPGPVPVTEPRIETEARIEGPGPPVPAPPVAAAQTVAPPVVARPPQPVQDFAPLTQALQDINSKIDNLVRDTNALQTAQDELKWRQWTQWSTQEQMMRAGVAQPPGLFAQGTSPQQDLADMRVTVTYHTRCLGTAVTVAERLIALGTDPEMVEGSVLGQSSARVIYARPDHLQAAVRIAESISDIEPVDDPAMQSDSEVDGVQVYLSQRDGCERSVG